MSILTLTEYMSVSLLPIASYFLCELYAKRDGAF